MYSALEEYNCRIWYYLSFDAPPEIENVFKKSLFVTQEFPQFFSSFISPKWIFLLILELSYILVHSSLAHWNIAGYIYLFSSLLFRFWVIQSFISKCESLHYFPSVQSINNF